MDRFTVLVVACCLLFSTCMGGTVATARRLAQTTAPAPGPLPPCICSVASIYDGQTFCFSATDGIPIPNDNGTGTHPQKVANPNCSVFTSAYTCGAAVNIRTSLVQTTVYPNNTQITNQALNCTLNSFNGPVPAPAAATPSAGAPGCVLLPASDYGPTGRLAYASGGGTDCTVPDGTICTFTVDLSKTGGKGTAKVCASAAYENTYFPGYPAAAGK